MLSLEELSELGGVASVDAADTAAATGAWIDVRQVIGDVRIISDVGVVAAGSIQPALEHADDAAGTNAEALGPRDGAFTQVTTGNDPLREARHVKAKSTRGFIRYIGTIVTGPAQVAVTVEGRLKYE